MENVEHNPTMSLLMKVAEQLIVDKGCKNTTMRDIVNSSGVSNGGIYHYLKSKEELFSIILQSKIDKIDEQFNKTVCESELGDLDGPLRSIIEGFFSHLMGREQAFQKIFVYLLSFHNDPSITLVLENFNKKWTNVLTNWIKIGQSAGAIDSSLNAEETGSMLSIFFFGLLIEDNIGIMSMEINKTLKIVSNLLRVNN
jgi:TetR/AcrR family transcriptional regulator, cholesterol catabolism regulator